jgi:hypothetical protein
MKGEKSCSLENELPYRTAQFSSFAGMVGCEKEKNCKSPTLADHYDRLWLLQPCYNLFSSTSKLDWCDREGVDNSYTTRPFSEEPQGQAFPAACITRGKFCECVPGLKANWSGDTRGTTSHLDSFVSKSTNTGLFLRRPIRTGLHRGTFSTSVWCQAGTAVN